MTSRAFESVSCIASMTTGFLRYFMGWVSLMSVSSVA